MSPFGDLMLAVIGKETVGYFCVIHFLGFFQHELDIRSTINLIQAVIHTPFV
uniref:Uncharacterized protein n=1 Tax=Anguilla anguilla TaxID=7936 RepID=A0A0E9XA99_ANGAN